MILAIVFMSVLLAFVSIMLVLGFKADVIALTSFFAAAIITGGTGLVGTRIGLANRFPMEVTITHLFDSVATDLSIGYTTNGNIMAIPSGTRGLCSDSCKLVILSTCLFPKHGLWSGIDLNYLSRTPAERVDIKSLLYTNRGSPCQQ